MLSSEHATASMSSDSVRAKGTAALENSAGRHHFQARFWRWAGIVDGIPWGGASTVPSSSTVMLGDSTWRAFAASVVTTTGYGH